VTRAEKSFRQTRAALYTLALKLHAQMFPNEKRPGPRPTVARRPGSSAG